jgi:hypothetical protein
MEDNCKYRRWRENMKKKIFALTIVTMMLLVGFISVEAGKPEDKINNSNGAPSGYHFNLNLIGKDKTDILPNDDNNGHRIFVNLYKKSRIYLEEGPFEVIDADATDGKAVFQLPKPENQYDAEGNYLAPGAYEVWIRPLGKPGGNGIITTCATDPDTGEEICSTDNVILVREKGKSTFGDVTKQLTTVTYYDTILEKYITVDIFDEQFEDYFWGFDNNGLKIVQLRFYPI